MISVSINGRIKNKKKVEEFVYNTLIHLMPRLRRTVYIDVNIVTRCEKQHYALCMGDKESVEIEVARESKGIKFSLEEALEYIQKDEYVEVTPNHLRLRKVLLKEVDRKRSKSI